MNLYICSIENLADILRSLTDPREKNFFLWNSWNYYIYKIARNVYLPFSDRFSEFDISEEEYNNQGARYLRDLLYERAWHSNNCIWKEEAFSILCHHNAPCSTIVRARAYRASAGVPRSRVAPRDIAHSLRGLILAGPGLRRDEGCARRLEAAGCESIRGRAQVGRRRRRRRRRHRSQRAAAHVWRWRDARGSKSRPSSPRHWRSGDRGGELSLSRWDRVTWKGIREDGGRKRLEDERSLRTDSLLDLSSLSPSLSSLGLSLSRKRGPRSRNVGRNNDRERPERASVVSLALVTRPQCETLPRIAGGEMTRRRVSYSRRCSRDYLDVLRSLEIDARLWVIIAGYKLTTWIR